MLVESQVKFPAPQNIFLELHDKNSVAAFSQKNEVDGDFSTWQSRGVNTVYLQFRWIWIRFISDEYVFPYSLRKFSCLVKQI